MSLATGHSPLAADMYAVRAGAVAVMRAIARPGATPVQPRRSRLQATAHGPVQCDLIGPLWLVVKCRDELSIGTGTVKNPP